ncbi:MAG: transporter substrate-binding domain-containing protein [Muricomes sp.]
MIMSAMSPEEATSAADSVNLSDAYYDLGDVIAVKADNNDITKKEDLEGKTIGYQTGSASEQAADKLEGLGIKVSTKNPYNRNSDAFAELENGRIDAVIVSYPYAVTQSKEDKTFKVVNDPIQSCDLVAITVQGSDALTAKYNGALKAVKDSGKYAEIEKKWLSIEE